MFENIIATKDLTLRSTISRKQEKQEKHSFAYIILMMLGDGVDKISTSG